MKKDDTKFIEYFPPPWNPNEFPEKTQGWLAFQDAMRNDPEFYNPSNWS